MNTKHNYESPIALHGHNTPCKLCGKTARHMFHKFIAAPKLYGHPDRNCCSYHRTGGYRDLECTPANGERA